MKVALLTNFIPPYRLPLYRAIAESCEQFSVFLSVPMEPNRAWPVEWEELDVSVQRCLSLRRTWRHPAGFSDEVYIHLPVDTLARLRRVRPDVVVSVEFGFRTVLAALYCFLSQGTPLAIWATVSESTEQNRGRTRLLVRRLLARRADLVLVNGASGRRYVEALGVADDRIVAAPYSTDPAHLENPLVPDVKQPTSVRRLLYLGQLSDRKGLAPFVETLSRWLADRPDTKVQLTVVGSGEQEERLADLRHPQNLTVEMLGEVSYEQVDSLYGSAEILVFPTLADEWGLVTNEALAAGVPVLGSLYAQSVEELVVEGVTGWSFRPDDRSDVVRAIDAALAKSPSELQMMGEACRKAARSIEAPAVAMAIVAALKRIR